MKKKKKLRNLHIFYICCGIYLIILAVICINWWKVRNEIASWFIKPIDQQETNCNLRTHHLEYNSATGKQECIIGYANDRY